jgi:cholesterol transport system auxiliary component
MRSRAVPLRDRLIRAAALPAVALLAAGLASCGSLEKPPTTFDLTVPAELKPARGGRAQLVVPEPSALELLNSQRIMVRPKDGQVTYLSGAQWADRLPALVQARLIQTFENAHRIASVGRPGDKLVADATLVTEIRTFELDVSGGNAALVEVSAKIVSESTGRILAAQLFRATVPSVGTAGAEASAALDQALQAVMREIVGWASARA